MALLSGEDTALNMLSADVRRLHTERDLGR